MSSKRLLAFGGVTVLALAGIGAMAAWGSGSAADPAQPGEKGAKAGTYTVDPVHTSVVFKIKHLNTSNFYGRFDKTKGSFTLGDTGSFEFTVETDSVDTNQSKRDSDIKGPDLLGAKEFSEIKFVGKNFKKSGDGWSGTGDLTFRGVTKPLAVEIHQTGAGKSPMGNKEIAGIETTFTIKRSDFGSKAMAGMLGDEVTLWVASEGGLK